MVYQEKEQFMKLSEIEKLQEDLFKKMVRYAYERVPMYRRRMKEAGVHPDDIKKLEDKSKVPFTVKNDLRDHYPWGILAVEKRDVVRLHMSSGTTGKPTVVAYTQRDLDRWSDLMARSYSAAGVTREDIVQNAYGYGLFTGGLGFHMGAERLGATVIPSATGNTKRQLMIMKDFQSTVLAATPSYAVYLSEKAAEEGYDPKRDFNLRIGMFGAEPWSDETRRKIEEALGLEAFDMYGMSELYGPGVAVECPEHNGLHIWSDEFLVEVIDPETGEVLGEGEEGELVFTMLTREAMPLLRYRTRDLTRVTWEECSCGRYHPRILRIKGRSDDMLIVGGVNVFPSQVEDVLMGIEELGEQYQIIVDRDILDRLYVKVEVSPKVYGKAGYDEKKLKEKVESSLQAALTLRARVELLPPGTLPRTEGKAKRVIDLRKKV
ncbi:MAG: phenylacetate--CoA ligase [Thermoplasmata archaeon]|nr:phenylacetate--CoA ligase [Thermoplasmata archaeon]